MSVQSVLFDINKFNVTQARKWLAQHKFKSRGKVDTTDNYHRFRQRPPLQGEIFRTHKAKPGIKIIFSLKKIVNI